MKPFVLIFLMLLGIKGISQGVAPCDSCIRVHTLKGALTDTTPANTDKKHYQYFTVNMLAGDVAVLQYASNDYVVEAAVQDTSGKGKSYAADGMYFKKNGSTITVPFRAPYKGIFTFILTSKQAAKKGNFTANVYYYYSNKSPISDTDSYCDKLHWLVENSKYNFEFIKGNRLPKDYTESYATRFNLLPGTVSEITQITGAAYKSVFTAVKQAEQADSLFNALRHQTQACLPGHEYKYTELKGNIVKECSFTLTGGNEHELNMTHSLAQIKSRVTIRLSKAPVAHAAYILELIID